MILLQVLIIEKSSALDDRIQIIQSLITAMEYISTRGTAPRLDFEKVTLTGLASDGGLYLPRKIPQLEANTIRSYQNMEYSELAAAILSNFTGRSVPPEDLNQLVKRAYGHFHHDAVAPVIQLDDNLYFMELFHGPTLAFKDYALQVLGQFFHYFLDKHAESCTIVGATSGDTGSAAIAGIRGLQSVRLFMLHPRGRVSEVQRRQMTTVTDNNIHNLAVDGTFDDCQNLVKALFNDRAFKERYRLSAVNSINWARIAAQVVYYFRAALVLGSPDRQVNFSVPTGNFGNVLAGYIAMQMGLPIKRLIIGSNRNDILTRFFETGVMKKMGVTPTLSPSMDIQISSNFERYLFLLLGRDSAHLCEMMEEFNRSGSFSISRRLLSKAQQIFGAYRLDDQQISSDIRELYHSTGEIIEPHSIIGVSAARRESDTSVPTIVLGTAHPAKFPEAIHQSTHRRVALPDHAGDIMNMDEYYSHMKNDLAALKAHIEQHA